MIQQIVYDTERSWSLDDSNETSVKVYVQIVVGRTKHNSLIQWHTIYNTVA